MTTPDATPTTAPSTLRTLVEIVLRLSRSYQAALDEPLVRRVHLHVKELTVLSAVMHGDAYPSVIARRHQLPPPTVTRLVTGLTDRGLVRREAEQGDLRRYHLALTDEGVRVGQQTQRVSERILQEVLGHLPPELITRAGAVLAELERAASDHTDS